MNRYRLDYESWDSSDTTTSDGFSGGPVGWGKEKEWFEVDSDKQAREHVVQFLKERDQSLRKHTNRRFLKDYKEQRRKEWKKLMVRYPVLYREISLPQMEGVTMDPARTSP